MENRLTTFTVSLRNLPCGRILNHCNLININHAVRPHIKLITTSKSALFLEQNQSAVVHVSEVLRYRVACLMICKYRTDNEVPFTHFRVLGWPCHCKITVLGISSSKKRISWLKKAIFESRSCEMFTWRKPDDSVEATCSRQLSLSRLVFAFLSFESKFEEKKNTLRFRSGQQLTIDQVKRLESNVFVQLNTFRLNVQNVRKQNCEWPMLTSPTA